VNGVNEVNEVNGVALSVVIPVHNEAENVGPLVDEIRRTLDGKTSWEIVVVDDASDDDTVARLEAAARDHSDLRIVRHRRHAGQSTAIHSGVRFARGTLIATLDGDGQNDPADVPALLETYRARHRDRPLLVAGHRVSRRDTWLTRISSRIANAVRGTLLGDRTPDTGCGLKLFERDAFLALPYFDHMHRFLPALTLRQGGDVIAVPVRHRPRSRGRSHYGVMNRLWIGIVDLFGVMWLLRRAKDGEPYSASPGNT
jgi:dolichol-phosphate mannosyltransferase